MPVPKAGAENDTPDLTDLEVKSAVDVLEVAALADIAGARSPALDAILGRTLPSIDEQGQN